MVNNARELRSLFAGPNLDFDCAFTLITGRSDGIGSFFFFCHSGTLFILDLSFPLKVSFP